MNKKQCISVGSAILASAFWITSSFASDSQLQAGGDLSAEASGSILSDISLNPDTRPIDPLLARAIERLDQLPSEAQDDIAALQQTVAAIRDAWQNEYHPGVAATAEEIEAAREQFRSDLADQISNAKELRKQVVSQLRDDVRGRIEGVEASAEALAAAAAYKELGLQLGAAWRSVRAELGADATAEEVAAARQVFLEANADLVAEQKLLAAELRLSVSANASAHAAVPDRAELPDAAREFRSEMTIARLELMERRQQAREEFLNLGPGAREERRQALVEELRSANNDMKERRRQLVEDLRAENGGDRRAED